MIRFDDFADKDLETLYEQLLCQNKDFTSFRLSEKK